MSEALLLCGTIIVITVILSASALYAWRGWLALRRFELEQGRNATKGETGVRIELAGVRERLKKLESIASGVDL